VHAPGAAGGTNAPPVATATLTLQYPAGFHTASSRLRRPAYVNAQPPRYLDVWVVSGGTAVHAVNSGSGANIVATSSGSQTFSIPLYSTNASRIVAYEQDAADGNPGNLLAIGEADIASITAGSAPQVSLTMLMNARSVGIMSDPNDANLDATTLPFYKAFGSTSCVTGPSGPLYFFAADGDGGFVDVAGAGGISRPTVSSWTSNATSPSNTLTQTGGVTGSYNVAFNNLNGGLTASVTAANPALAIVVDAVQQGGAYPGMDFLFNQGYDYWLDSNFYTVYYGSSTITNSIEILPDCPEPVLLSTSLVAVPGGLDTATQAPATSSAFPVLYFNGYTYWPFSDIDNDVEFFLAKYDANFNYISTTAYGGDRYISNITVNPLAQTVTFNGQYELAHIDNGVTIDWDALP